jgi:hypothetical protein
MTFAKPSTFDGAVTVSVALDDGSYSLHSFVEIVVHDTIIVFIS